jgi:NADH:ubiquinone oxidoreductase subunit 2 (subunit N)
VSDLATERDRLVRRADIVTSRFLRYVDELARRRPRRRKPNHARRPHRVRVVVLAVALFALGVMAQWMYARVRRSRALTA